MEKIKSDLLSDALDGSFELIKEKYIKNEDVGFSGQFLVGGKWYFPKFGCDSLQKFIDILKDEQL